MPCLTAENWPRRPPDVNCNGVNLSINPCLCCNHFSRMTIDSHRSVRLLFWQGKTDDFSSVLKVPMAIGSGCSSWEDLWTAFLLTIVNISSFRPFRILCTSKRLCFVEVLVTRIKINKVRIASKTPFAGRRSWLTKSGPVSNCKRLFSLVISTTYVTERS